MRPSLALDEHREAIRRIVAAHRGLNPRVFGSALRGEDGPTSDLDLLIDPAEGMTLFDLAAIAAAVEQVAQIKVDIRTPDDLAAHIRSRIVAESRPV